MKLLLTSPDALINLATGNFFEGIEEVLNDFLAKDSKNAVITISIHREKLTKIPKHFHPIPIKFELRGSPKLIDFLKSKLGYDYPDIIVLGSKVHDLAQATNSKLLLLSAKYAISNNPSDNLYKRDYGIPISDATALKIFFDRFSNISNPWYYKLEIPPITTVYALTNANTYSTSSDMKVLNEKFKACLKQGESEYAEPLVNFFLVSVYKIYQEVNSIDLWAIYPTSSGASNDDLGFFLKKARESFKGREAPNLFERHTGCKKRHETSPKVRIENGCESQFLTISLNPHYRGKLKGMSICVIDDFTTYGTSVETVRNLLEIEGVSRIVFIAMGKFGNAYYKYDYRLYGDPFGKYAYGSPKPEYLTGTFNNSANREFLDSIKGLI